MVDGYIPNISFNIKRIVGGNIINEANPTVFTRERDIEREEREVVRQCSSSFHSLIVTR